MLKFCINVNSRKYQNNSIDFKDMNFPLLLLAISLIASGAQCTIQKDIGEKEVEKR